MEATYIKQEDFIKANEELKTVVIDAVKKQEDNGRKGLDAVKVEMGTKFDELKSDFEGKLKAYEVAQKATKDLPEFAGNEKDHQKPAFEKAYDVANYSAKYYQGDKSEIQLAHKAIDELFILNLLMKKNGLKFDNGGTADPSDGFNAFMNHYKKEHGVNLDNLFKKLTGKALTVSGMAGTALFPTQFGRTLYEDVQNLLECSSIFEVITMDQNPYKDPYLAKSTPAVMLTENELATDTETLVDTDLTLSAKRLVKFLGVTDEARMGSLINALARIRRDIIEAQADAIEQSIIDGDTAGTHQDTDVTSASDCRKAYNGLRKLCNSGAKSDCGTYNDANLNKVRKLMGKYGAPRRAAQSLTWIWGISQYLNSITALTNLVTVDKYAAAATIISGEIGRFYSIPVVLSSYIREDLDANGVYESGGTRTIALLVNNRGFSRGQWGSMGIEEERMPKYGRTDIIATQHHAFRKNFPTASNVVGMAYNISV